MRFTSFIITIVIVLFAAIAGPLFAQDSQTDKKVISNDELKKFCVEVAALTSQAVELRKKPAGISSRDIVKEAERLRQQLEAVILTVAATRPAPADQRAAMLLAMGTKGAELALWHYIYGVMANSPRSTEYGDVLIKTAADQIEAARQLFPNGKI
jgi:hypothetical protein